MPLVFQAVPPTSRKPVRIRTAAVVLAGGSGSRLGTPTNKVYLPVAGEPVIVWALKAMATAPGLTRLVLVIRPDDPPVPDRIEGIEIERVDGGQTRTGSEFNALRRLAPAIDAGELDVIAIHDGARPAASPELVANVVTTAAAHGGAVPGLPIDDLAEVDAHGHVVRALTGPHTRVQTPQAFAAAPLLAAYDAAERDGFEATDTAACVERYTDLDVRHVDGEIDNLKVTVAADLSHADQILTRRQ